jgi:outer membrane protein assembly factor BamE (lipoprotein component of BamABCDE complex)
MRSTSINNNAVVLARRFTFVVLCFALGGLSACRKAGVKEAPTMSEANKHEHYVRAPEATEKLLAGFSQLSAGMSDRDVIDSLGKPSADNTLVRKDGQFVAKVFYYYIEVFEAPLLNEQRDKYLRLEFDQANRLTSFSAKSK